MVAAFESRLVRGYSEELAVCRQDMYPVRPSLQTCPYPEELIRCEMTVLPFAPVVRCVVPVVGHDMQQAVLAVDRAFG